MIAVGILGIASVVIGFNCKEIGDLISAVADRIRYGVQERPEKKDHSHQ